MGKLFNRVRMTVSGAPGTGTITLGAAYSAAFCSATEGGVVNSDIVSYFIEDGSNFEIGIGTYTSAGTALSRDTVRLSKIAGVSGVTKLTLTSAAIVYLSPGQEDFDGPVSVLSYGAVAGDATKYVINQTAFNAALATGKPVYVPDGQTFYTQAITIPSNAHSIFGRATLIAAGTIAVAALLSGTSCTNIAIRDLTIQINTTTYATLDAINLTTCTDPLVENVTCNGYNGILTTSCTRPRVRSCRVTDFNNIGIVDRGGADVEINLNRVTTTNTTTSFYGIQGSAIDGGDISHNWVSNAFSFGIVVSGLDSGAFTPAKNVTITSNRTLNTGLEGINLANVQDFAVTGNVCRWTNGSSRDFGISCFGDPNTSPVGTTQRGTISGNSVYAAGKSGIVLCNNCQYITISGNTIYDANKLNGATVYHIAGVMVYGRGALNNKVIGNNIIDPSTHLTWATNEYDDGVGAGSGPNNNSFSGNDGVGTSGGSNVVGAASRRGNNEFYFVGAGSSTGVGPIVIYRPALTIKDANLALTDDVDPTKEGRLQLSGVTTGQVRTLTWPDADGPILIKSKIPMLISSQSGVGGAGVTSFFVVGASATELNIYGTAPMDGTFKNLFVKLNTAPGGVQTSTITLRVNGSDTAITITVTGAAVSGSDDFSITGHTAAITKGQTFSLKIVGSASAAATIVNGGIELDTA